MGSPFKMKPGKGTTAKTTGQGMKMRGLIGGLPEDKKPATGVGANSVNSASSSAGSFEKTLDKSPGMSDARKTHDRESTIKHYGKPRPYESHRAMVSNQRISGATGESYDQSTAGGRQNERHLRVESSKRGMKGIANRVNKEFGDGKYESNYAKENYGDIPGVEANTNYLAKRELGKMNKKINK
tara:strand:+ start:357 stop:908 length:552 start_codon:yes stop_codon:yes gene_type:complete